MPNAKQVNKELTQNPSFSEYWQNNIAVIPEIDGRPQVNGKYLEWGKFYNPNHEKNNGSVYVPTEGEIADWDWLDNHGYGLITGRVSGIIALDFDYAQTEQIVRAEQLLGTTPVKKFGSKGLTLFYAYNGEKSENWKLKKEGLADIVLCELKGDGSKVTIPPSIHRDTKKAYTWVGTHSLFAGKDILPRLPSNYREILDSLFSLTRSPEREYQRIDYDTRPTYAEAIKALYCCNPNCSNDEWVQIGMALKAEFGAAAFHDFDAWSSGGKSYDRSTIRGRWRSFDSHSITYGTLIYYAKQSGYQVPRKETPAFETVTVIDDWNEASFEAKLTAIEADNKLPEFYVNAPHHIKEICEWIASTAICPQPILSLGSTLAFLGFLMARDFEFQGLRPHLYVANIAYSGDGKGHLNRCVRGLLKSADMIKHIAYGFTSDTSILNDLKRTSDHSAFFLTDELQTLLHSISKRSSNSAEGRAVAVLLQAYTEPEVRSVTKANIKDNPTIIVDNPTIGICGYTTPYMFEACLGSTEVLSGFVGRLSTFRGNKYIPDENLNFDSNTWKNIPDNILQIIRDISNNRYREYLPDGSFVYGTKEISANCIDLIRQYRKKLIDKRNLLRAENNPLEALYARAAEVMIKYAMIASKGKQIDENCINWAISVVEYNVSIIYDVAINFADTAFERNKNKLVQYIDRCGGIITKTKIAQNCKFFEDAAKRHAAIEDLVLAEILEKVENRDGDRVKTGYRLKKPSSL